MELTIFYSNSTWTDRELEEGEWRTLALQRMAKVLRTHVIKFDFEDEKGIEKGRFFLHVSSKTFVLGCTSFTRKIKVVK